jgi:hypothetical protein
MTDYDNGKNYTIRSHQTTDIYIGSTTQSLAKRFGCHKSSYKSFESKKSKKYCTSYILMKYDDAYIELLENYPCESKELLLKREGEFIRAMDCVNKNKKKITEPMTLIEYCNFRLIKNDFPENVYQEHCEYVNNWTSSNVSKVFPNVSDK